MITAVWAWLQVADRLRRQDHLHVQLAPRQGQVLEPVPEQRKDHAEGAHLRALREIRVRAAPSWDDEEVRLAFWFIKEAEPEGHAPGWDEWVDEWSGLFQ